MAKRPLSVWSKRASFSAKAAWSPATLLAWRALLRWDARRYFAFTGTRLCACFTRTRNLQIDSCRIRWLARFEWKKTWWISSFNSTEKRLARVLLLLANFGQDGKPQQVIPRISQETLSQIVSAS